MAARVKLARGLALALGLAACDAKDDAPEANRAPATKAPVETKAGAAAPSEVAPTTDLDALLEWLDPKATGVGWIDLDPKLSPTTIAAVFAVPPRAADMLTMPRDVDSELDAVVDSETSPPSTWFAGPALVTRSMLSSGPYLVRKLARPRAEIEATLADAKFDASEDQGFAVHTPRGPFGWRIVFLTDDVVAFIPTREPGSGLDPLTAGRDMPASDLETELRRVLAEDKTLAVSLYAAGPMLHFDLDTNVLGARLELRNYPDGSGRGLDGSVLLEPDGDAATVVDALQGRAPVGENEQVRTLAGAVAYSLDGSFVVGRLQVPLSKLAILQVES